MVILVQFLVLSAASLTAGDMSQPDSGYVNLLSRGIEYYEAGYLEKSIEIFEMVTTQFPAVAQGFNALGSLYLRQAQLAAEKGDVGKSRQLLTGAGKNIDAALSLDRNYGYAYYNRGLVYLQLHRYPESAKMFRKALELKGDDPLVWQHLGYALYNDPMAGEAQVNDAISAWKHALEMSSAGQNAAKVHVELGKALLSRGDIQSAIEQYNAALGSAPDFTEARFGLGQAFEAQGALQNALSEYENIILHHPDFARAYDAKGNIEYVQKNLLGAIRAYQKAILKDSSDCRLYAKLLKVIDILIENFRTGRNQAYRRAELCNLPRSRYLYGHPQPAESQKELDSIIARYISQDRDYLRSYSICRDSFLVFGFIGRRLEQYYQAIRLDPEKASPYFHLTQYFDILRRIAEEMGGSKYYRAMKINPNCVLDGLKFIPMQAGTVLVERGP